MFHKWELLEALQSLVVYMLLRIIEGQQEYTNFDTQLLVSITVSRQICCLSLTNRWVAAYLLGYQGDLYSPCHKVWQVRQLS